MTSDLVVAADGIRSIVRAQLFPDVRIRYSGKTSWRAVVTDIGSIDDRFVIVWGPWVRETLAATTRGQLMRHDVYHLAPDALPSYVQGRTVLVGDAAHGFLPTMGQGANTALEDGVCVGRIIGEPVAGGADLTPALARFDRARRPRCRRIAQRSVLTARLGADLAGGWPQSVRNTFMRLLPAGPTARAGASVLRWTPPPGIPRAG